MPWPAIPADWFCFSDLRISRDGVRGCLPKAWDRLPNVWECFPKVWGNLLKPWEWFPNLWGSLPNLWDSLPKPWDSSPKGRECLPKSWASKERRIPCWDYGQVRKLWRSIFLRKEETSYEAVKYLLVYQAWSFKKDNNS